MNNEILWSSVTNCAMLNVEISTCKPDGMCQKILEYTAVATWFFTILILCICPYLPL